MKRRGAPAEALLATALQIYRRRLAVRGFLEDLLLVGSGSVAVVALVLIAGDQGLLYLGAAGPTRVALFVLAALAVVAVVTRGRAHLRQDLMAVAGDFESRRSELRGRLVPAAWLLTGEGSAATVPAYMRAACLQDAAAAVAGKPGTPPVAKELVRRRGILFAVVAVVLAMAHLVAPNRMGAAWAALGGEPGWTVPVRETQGAITPRLAGAEILYRFPAYTGLEPRTAQGPGDLEVLAGSHASVRFRVFGQAQKVRAFTREGEALVARVSEDRRSVEVDVPVEADSGYGVAFLSSGGQEQGRRLFGVRALPDQPPRVRLNKPGEDLMMARPGGVLSLSGEADDDLEVTGVTLRYIATRGSGETYRFAEGSVAPRLRRLGDQVLIEAELDVGGLLGGKDDHGGVLSYHLEARDSNTRTGPSLGVSETFLVRVPGDDSAALASGGIVLPPAESRLSQRQLLEDTRRLHARRPTLEDGAFRAAAQVLAHAQHALSGSFTGLVEEGGVNAAEDHEPEGAPGQQVMGLDPNAGRIRTIEGVEMHLHGSEALPYAADVLTALNAALARMFEAERALHLADTGTAMTQMQEAIRFLQEARKYDRLLFRALPVEVTLDPEARGVGTLEDVGVLPLPQRSAAEPGDLEVLLQEVREALQSDGPIAGERLSSWSHRAFALPGGSEAATLFGQAAESNGSGNDRVRRAAGMLALLLPVAESVPAPRQVNQEALADRYFQFLGSVPVSEASP